MRLPHSNVQAVIPPGTFALPTRWASVTTQIAKPNWPKRLSRHSAESRVLIVFLGTVAGLWMLGKIASEVMEGDTLAFDRALLLMPPPSGRSGDADRPPPGCRWQCST